MKVKLKSVLKTVYHDVQCFDEQQIMTRSGNTLCIKEIGKNECDFIHLNSDLNHLFCFKPATSRKGAFTVEKINQNVELAYYNLKSQRKYISLSQQSSFFYEAEKIELQVDEYDNSIIYGGARSKQGVCVFLGDIGKGKLLTLGFMNSYQDLKVDMKDNLSLSVCCFNGSYNIVKHLRYIQGQWEISEDIYKKIQNTVFFQHQILYGNRYLFASRLAVYHFEQNDLLQTLEMEEGEGIREIMKIHRGLLLFGENNNIRVFIEDSDEVTFLEKGYLRLELEPEDKIARVLLSHNNEDVIVRTMKNNMYVWKTENLDLDANHFDFAFVKVENSCASSHEGSISISTGKKYCLLAGTRNVTLWSIQKNEFVLSSEYVNSLEAESKKKVILCCAINPDGNSFMLGFQDRIKVYQILLTKFKYFAEIPIKKCHRITYSHGGQLVACHFGKTLNATISIYNTLRMVEVAVFKIQSDPSMLVWNELDDQIIVVTESNTIQLYNIADNTRVNSVKFEEKVNYARIDYKLRKILVSTSKMVYLVSNGSIVDSFEPPVSHFHYIFPLYGIYLIACTNGVLHLSPSLKFENYQSYPLFSQSSFEMVCRNGFLLAYSSFSQVQILQALRPNSLPKKTLNDDIVMVEKDEIKEFYEKIKILESNFQMLTSATQMKLEEEKNIYEASIDNFRTAFQKQIRGLNQANISLTSTKLKQERETEQTFQQVETGQIKNVHQIEKMYERKCNLLQEKVMELEQRNLQQKQKYEAIMSQIEVKYHRDVSNIRSLYEKKTREESIKAEQSKKSILEDKQKMEFKLFELEEQNQFVTQQIQQSKDSIIAKLTANINSLETNLQEMQIKNQTTMNEFQRLKGESENSRRNFIQLETKYGECLNRIKMLEKEVGDKNTVIEEKDHSITELNHQIADLEKAKYVLSFRTAEIRKQLEPKEALTDRLKSQISKLDQEFKILKKKNFELTQRIQKQIKINEILKKDNTEVKTSLKSKERVHSELCTEIFKIYNSVPSELWSLHLTKLYKNFICEQKMSSREGRKGDSAEELSRHLMHVEMSLQQVATSNDKIVRGKEKDISRRMKQNSDLLLEINLMKQKEKQMAKAHQQILLNNDRLQKELDSNYTTARKNSTRAQTSNTTRRVVLSRDALYSREKSFLIDRGQGSKQKELRDMLRQRNRIGSTHTTLMYKDDRRQKSAKFFDMARELQGARNTIKIQQQMLEELNQRLFAAEQIN